MRKLFTSESVTEGHPDKLCDYISDSILDAYLEKDEFARVACETVAGKGEIFITGEITSSANVDIERVARSAIKEVGYTDDESGIDYKNCKVTINLSKQSPDIALGVDNSYETKVGENNEEMEGAGDQGIMFGYACNETESYMPYAIHYAHKLAKRLVEVRKNGEMSYLRPDGKTQVTVEYENDKPKRIETILISTQHLENISMDKLENDILKKVVYKVIPEERIDKNTKIYINPTGRFVIGGPLGDTGLTGRKIIVDTYGGYSRHGGGAFSGKDATKVDRSAAYMLRHIAKNIVANGIADKCELQVSYAIGIKEPLSIWVNTFGTEKIQEDKIVQLIKEKFDLTPEGIIDYLNLKMPIYANTTNFGHFGKENLSWEKIIKL